MSGSTPRRLARLLRLPGATSFRRFARTVRRAGELEAELRLRELNDEGLGASALGRRGGGSAERPAEGPPDRVAEGSADAPALRGEALATFLAVARESARRTLGLSPFDEQLLACCALMHGNAVEMDTGEGKTLVGALAAIGHVLAGRRVHVISVNDYLAERDAEWMRPLFALFGIEVGWIGQLTSHAERRRVYRGDVAYAPVREIGFDVLRDRFAIDPAERVAPEFDAAVVDEVDSVMIDEAMTPLVLAGASEQRAEDLTAATELVEALDPELHYAVSSDSATVTLTDEGLDRVEERLGGVNLYAAEQLPLLTRINLALHARVLVRRDVDYLVVDGAVKLIDTSRGRIAHLQRWPDGLHAAIEAKEGVGASAPGVILDTVTIQDLLLQYRTICGMSGTVTAVAEDLIEFYELPAGRVERHLPNRRVDETERVFRTAAERLAAVVDEVVSRHALGQPVLVGTQSVAASERLATALRDAGVEPRVLNARNDAEEASIVACAGELGAVTISTQMSGRGTDIHLGGSDGRDSARVLECGGLLVIAVGRYPSRRLDAQLYGRAGRQGDPGRSIAFVSLDDELVQQHAPEYMLTAIARGGDALAPAELRRIVATAQRIAEGQRLDRHRSTWQYNRAIAAQRARVLDHRNDLLSGDGAMRALHDRIPEHLAAVGVEHPGALSSTVRAVTTHYLDERWTEHLAELQEIRDGIHLRALAGQRPADEFHRIALREFHGFFDVVHAEAAAFLGSLAAADLGRELSDLGLRRPSATWTYMVTDDPFGSPGDRLARALGKQWRRRVLGIE